MSDTEPMPLSWYDLCDEHEWAGIGECPGCKAVRLADESIDRQLPEGDGNHG